MLASLMMVVQASAPSGAGSPLPPDTIDLLAAVRPLRCPEPDSEAIVVCGVRQGDDQRVFRRDAADDRAPARAETRLFGDTRGAIEAEGVDLPGLGRSNRLMFRFKLPF